MKVELVLDQKAGVLILYDIKYKMDIVRIKLIGGSMSPVKRAIDDAIAGYHSPVYLEGAAVGDTEATF